MLTHRPFPTSLPSKNHLNLLTKRLCVAVAGVALAMSVAPAGAALAASADAATFTYGQDVSGYESDHDWSSSPAKFGIIKATEGLTFRDSSFVRHWRKLAKKGIVRGAYHFGHPSNDPKDEADHFLSVVDEQPAKRGDLLVLDLETTDGESVAHVNNWAKAWLDYVKAKTGVTPMFYSNWDFADTYGYGLARFPLWVADYNRPKGDVTPPADWTTWTIHQYTEYPIDQNVSLLTPDQLRALGRH
jgi:lysozyme